MSYRVICLLIGALALVGNAVSSAAPRQTALDRYVHAPDPAYRYELVRTVPMKGYTAYLLDLTSQRWRSETEVDRPEWKHWLTVIRPDSVTRTTGLLFIGGGANNGRQPTRVDPTLVEAAVSTGSVAAELSMVPNQPLTFTGDKPRTEDALIAYTWDKFLRTGDESWPARLPMTKSAVRAMDAVTDFSKKQGLTVDRFVVAGASKRGWTTWTTAAVDPRVVALVPLVIDLLNMEKSFLHHYQAYGFWAPAVKDYEQAGIMPWMGTPQMRALTKLVEPYEYRDRLTMPKLIINAAGDQFFVPDSSQFYIDDLKGETHLRYVPNADHSLRNSDAAQSLIAFYSAVLSGTPRPRYKWKLEKNGDIKVSPQDKPTVVTLWQATNPEKRDFRLESIGPAYKPTPLQPAPDGTYVARVGAPAKGWTAYFVEMTFPGSGALPFKVTTPIRVTPNRLPYDKPKPGRSVPPAVTSAAAR